MAVMTVTDNLAIECLIDSADLSLGFYDLSVNTDSNRPMEFYEESTLSRVFDEDTLRLYLNQVFNPKKSKLRPNSKKIVSSLDPSKYGIDYMLGFLFYVQTVKKGGKQYKMINKPVAPSRQLVEGTSLPSQRNYGFRSGEKHYIYTGVINDIVVFPVADLPSGDRHALKGDLREDSLSGVRVSLATKYGYLPTQNIGACKTRKRLVTDDTHRVNPKTRASRKDLIKEGYRVTRLDYESNFYGTKNDGTIGSPVSNKSILAFSPDKLKNTKTKISWGGGAKESTYLSDYYAYASRYYKYEKHSNKKVRFLLANGKSIYYQVGNEPPKAIASMVIIEGALTTKLCDSVTLTVGDTHLNAIWDKCVKWSKTLQLSLLDPIDQDKISKVHKRRYQNSKKTSNRLNSKIRKLQALKKGASK